MTCFAASPPGNRLRGARFLGSGPQAAATAVFRPAALAAATRSLESAGRLLAEIPELTPDDGDFGFSGGLELAFMYGEAIRGAGAAKSALQPRLDAQADRMEALGPERPDAVLQLLGVAATRIIARVPERRPSALQLPTGRAKAAQESSGRNPRRNRRPWNGSPRSGWPGRISRGTPQSWSGSSP
ncbi:MAG: hypothetical protein LBW85_10650 [Deltaproteobacteria bacterium]|jgi:hypothetical protein|nr:hypothetical protein [Deltaproteobacteria bacterium]